MTASEKYIFFPVVIPSGKMLYRCILKPRNLIPLRYRFGRDDKEKKRTFLLLTNLCQIYLVHFESQLRKINGLSILVGIALTEKGKIALGSSAEQYQEHKTIEKSTPSHMDVVYLLTTLSKEIPTRKIIYNIAENTITIH